MTEDVKPPQPKEEDTVPQWIVNVSAAIADKHASGNPYLQADIILAMQEAGREVAFYFAGQERAAKVEAADQYQQGIIDGQREKWTSPQVATPEQDAATLTRETVSAMEPSDAQIDAITAKTLGLELRRDLARVFARAVLALAEPTRSQKLADAGHTRRPTWHALPAEDEPAQSADAVDAKRYRVLRDGRHGFEAVRLRPKPGKRWRGWGDEGDILKGQALDEAIDKALPPPPTEKDKP